jgi:DNA-binding transcriptional ArsR family regulator
MSSSEEPARLNDARIMRALAHPLRLRILALLASDGPASVTALSRRVGESTASVSYHLSQLARFGVVEEATEARVGRERPWRAVHRGIAWDMDEDAEKNTAASLLREVYLRERVRVIDDFVAGEEQLSAQWRKAAFFLDDIVHLTCEELDKLNQRIKAELRKVRRPDPRTRPADARRVTVFMYALPQTGTPPKEHPDAD